MLSHRQKVIIAFLLLYFIWGSTYLAIRFTIETLPIFMTAGLRFLLAGLILFLGMRYKEKSVVVTREHWKSAFIVGGFLLLRGNGSVVWAERVVPSSLAALIVATTPFWMVLLQWLWQKGQRPAAGVLMGIAVGFVGVGILILPDLINNSHDVRLAGVVALLMAALSWSIGSLYSRRAPLPQSPFLATGMEMIAGGILLLTFGFLQGEVVHIHPENFSFKSLAAFVYLIIFGSLVGFTSYIWLLKNVGVTKTSTYAYVNPIVAVILGCLLAGERLTGHIIFAASLIIISVIIITMNQKISESS